jgi:hypothetical protein
MKVDKHMASLVKSIQTRAPYSVYPLVEVYGGFRLDTISSFRGRGTLQTFSNTTFPSKEEAVAHILKNDDGHPFLITTQYASGQYEVDQYE